MSEKDRRIKLLLVDDEADLVDVLATRFRKRDIETTTANSGDEALAAAARNTFDVAIIDLKMPGMDGVETMHKLKTSQPFLETIMFTGHGTTESALEAGKLDAFRYVMKPCDFEELLRLVTSAYDLRRNKLREGYQAELQTVMEHSSTPRDILACSEQLRRKYEQD